jgi:thymidine kinase
MSLDIVLGPMWAGKSSYILGKIRRYRAIGWNVFVITNSIDDRYGHQVISNHDNEHSPAYSCKELLPLLQDKRYEDAKLVILEESQFFPDLFDFVIQAVDRQGKHVVCVGLDGDSERRPFGDILKLIPYCDHVEKITSLCTECCDGTPALFSYRKDSSKEQIQVGAEASYAPLCRKHFLSKKK